VSDFDTMRWGDTQTLDLSTAVVNADLDASLIVSSQMMNAKWQRPITWRLMISVAPQVGALDEGVVISVQVNLFVGVGQANQIVPLASLTFNPPYAGVTQFYDVPAETMQCQFEVITTPPAVTLGTAVTVTAMAAPVTDPRGIVDVRELLREHLAKGLPSRSSDPTDGDGQPRWMPPGFDDGVMRYRK
jgi:hypothetical protein